MGKLQPSFMISSIASGSATPSIHAQNASLMSGMSTRFETKPARSLAGIGVLPMRSASAIVRETVSSLVARPLITSTSFMTGTGLKKCIPTTRSAASPVAVAIEVIEIELVLVASTAFDGNVSLIVLKSFALISGFSVAASTAHPASLASSIVSQ